MKEVQEVTTSYNIRDRRKVIMLNNKWPVRHAYYKEYRELQKLCLTILQQQKHYIGVALIKFMVFYLTVRGCGKSTLLH